MGRQTWVASGDKIKEPFEGEMAESQIIVGMAADKKPPKAGHPAVGGTGKRSRVGNPIEHTAASPRTEKTCCPLVERRIDTMAPPIHTFLLSDGLQ